MSRFRIEHPRQSEVYAIGGVDHALGLFCEVFRDNRERPLKVVDVFTMKRPVALSDCFELLVAEGFLKAAELEETLVHLQDGTRMPKRLATIAKIVGEFSRCCEGTG